MNNEIMKNNEINQLMKHIATYLKNYPFCIDFFKATIYYTCNIKENIAQDWNNITINYNITNL